MPAQLRLISPPPFNPIERAAAALSRAFASDPMYVYVLPNDDRRVKRLELFFRSLLRIGHMQGDVYTAENGKGTAVWLPPHKLDVSFWNGARAGMGMLPFRWGFPGFARLLQCSTAFEKVHYTEMNTKDHWHLLILGVDPADQGRGLGSMLIANGTQKADAEGKACYLETCAPQNVDLYEKHGFRVIKKDRVMQSDLVFWGMRREPQLR